jgi:uncharacterized membrane protein HdeD (DUF308 family)
MGLILFAAFLLSLMLGVSRLDHPQERAQGPSMVIGVIVLVAAFVVLMNYVPLF